jgi:hypothetical protein
MRRWRWWTRPALIFGTNAIFAFVLSNVITTFSDRIHVRADGTELSLHAWGYQCGFASWMQPVHASLAYAITIVRLYGDRESALPEADLPADLTLQVGVAEGSLRLIPSEGLHLQRLQADLAGKPAVSETGSM